MMARHQSLGLGCGAIALAFLWVACLLLKYLEPEGREKDGEKPVGYHLILHIIPNCLYHMTTHGLSKNTKRNMICILDFYLQRLRKSCMSTPRPRKLRAIPERRRRSSRTCFMQAWWDRRRSILQEHMIVFTSNTDRSMLTVSGTHQRIL